MQSRQSPVPPASSADSQSSDSTVDRVCKITTELLGVTASSVTAATSLGDLGADELDFIELLMEIEDQFEITISDEAIENVTGTDDWQEGMKNVTMRDLAGIIDGTSASANGNPYVASFQDLHFDLNVTQQQIDAGEIVVLDVPNVGEVELRLPQIAKDGYMIRLPEILPNKGSVIAHINIE